MSQEGRIDDMASDAGSTGGSPHHPWMPAFPLPPMYPETVTQQESVQSALPRIVTDPIGRQTQSASSSSPSGRRSPNTQWSALGRTSPRASGIRKKKGVDPAIAALQTQLSRTTGEIGEQLDAASESVGQAQTTAQAALHHAQAAQAESARVRSMIDETLRAHLRKRPSTRSRNWTPLLPRWRNNLSKRQSRRKRLWRRNTPPKLSVCDWS